MSAVNIALNAPISRLMVLGCIPCSILDTRSSVSIVVLSLCTHGSTPPPFPDTPTWGNLGIWGDRLLDALETCNADKRAIELLEQRRLQRLNNEDNNHAEN